MIDIHTHILPSIDDGSQSVEESLQMMKEASRAGFTHIITTSHYIYNGNYNVNSDEREQIISALQQVINQMGVNVNLYNGAEAYITPELAALYYYKTIPTLANSRYVLFELPMNSKVLYVENVIKQLLEAKYIPIIAHPERYKCVQENINEAIKWVENGAYLQSNYASIIGKYGEGANKTLTKLLKNDLVSFLGTDTHSPNSIYTQMEEILQSFEKVIGKSKLYELTTYNPSQILENSKNIDK